MAKNRIVQWANKMTFRIRAFKSLFSDTFEHDEKDDEAPLIYSETFFLSFRGHL